MGERMLGLRRETRNNGYWCGCCRQSWEDADLTQLPTPEEFINEIWALHTENSDNFEGIIYENEDDVVFRCEVRGGKSWETWYLIKPNGKDLEIFSWARDKRPQQSKLPLRELPTKEEALKWLTA